MNFETINTILLDGDGVLWRSKEPVPGVQRFFKTLEASQVDWALLTNNGTKTINAYLERFAQYGINARADQIFSSAVVTASILKKQLPAAAVIYVIGEAGIQEALRSADFAVHTGAEYPDRVDAVVTSMDRDFHFSKLSAACILIRRGAQFYATNPDKTFPTPTEITPGAGSILAAVEAASGESPVVIGKPNAHLFTTALETLGAKISTSVMVGDRLETDILGAQQLGIRTIAVLTGIASREQIDASAIKPDLVLDSIANLANLLTNHQA
nr:HAD-IIA family hydrolase [Anaerolineae bacterium]